MFRSNSTNNSIILSILFSKKSFNIHEKVDNNLIEQYKIEIEEENSTNNAYPEISIIKQKGNEDEKVYINMNFLGLDLSGVPIKDSSDIKVFIIPALYVITTFFSMKMNSSINKKKDKKALITDGKEEKKKMQYKIQWNKQTKT